MEHVAILSAEGGDSLIDSEDVVNAEGKTGLFKLSYSQKKRKRRKKRRQAEEKAFSEAMQVATAEEDAEQSTITEPKIIFASQKCVFGKANGTADAGFEDNFADNEVQLPNCEPIGGNPSENPNVADATAVFSIFDGMKCQDIFPDEPVTTKEEGDVFSLTSAENSNFCTRDELFPDSEFDELYEDVLQSASENMRKSTTSSVSELGIIPEEDHSDSQTDSDVGDPLSQNGSSQLELDARIHATETSVEYEPLYSVSTEDGILRHSRVLSVGDLHAAPHHAGFTAPLHTEIHCTEYTAPLHTETSHAEYAALLHTKNEPIGVTAPLYKEIQHDTHTLPLHTEQHHTASTAPLSTDTQVDAITPSLCMVSDDADYVAPVYIELHHVSSARPLYPEWIGAHTEQFERECEVDRLVAASCSQDVRSTDRLVDAGYVDDRKVNDKQETNVDGGVAGEELEVDGNAEVEDLEEELNAADDEGEMSLFGRRKKTKTSKAAPLSESSQDYALWKRSQDQQTSGSPVHNVQHKRSTTSLSSHGGSSEDLPVLSPSPYGSLREIAEQGDSGRHPVAPRNDPVYGRSVSADCGSAASLSTRSLLSEGSSSQRSDTDALSLSPPHTQRLAHYNRHKAHVSPTRDKRKRRQKETEAEANNNMDAVDTHNRTQAISSHSPSTSYPVHQDTQAISSHSASTSYPVHQDTQATSSHSDSTSHPVHQDTQAISRDSPSTSHPQIPVTAVEEAIVLSTSQATCEVTPPVAAADCITETALSPSVSVRTYSCIDSATREEPCTVESVSASPPVVQRFSRPVEYFNSTVLKVEQEKPVALLPAVLETSPPDAAPLVCEEELTIDSAEISEAANIHTAGSVLVTPSSGYLVNTSCDTTTAEHTNSSIPSADYTAADVTTVGYTTTSIALTESSASAAAVVENTADNVILETVTAMKYSTPERFAVDYKTLDTAAAAAVVEDDISPATVAFTLAASSPGGVQGHYPSTEYADPVYTRTAEVIEDNITPHTAATNQSSPAEVIGAVSGEIHGSMGSGDGAAGDVERFAASIADSSVQAALDQQQQKYLYLLESTMSARSKDRPSSPSNASGSEDGSTTHPLIKTTPSSAANLLDLDSVRASREYRLSTDAEADDRLHLSPHTPIAVEVNSSYPNSDNEDCSPNDEGSYTNQPSAHDLPSKNLSSTQPKPESTEKSFLGKITSTVRHHWPELLAMAVAVGVGAMVMSKRATLF